MKKTLSIILSLVLCIACIATPVYADDLDAQVIFIDLERGFVYDCDGYETVSRTFTCGSVRVTITVEGRTTLDLNGNVTGFTCTSCSARTTILQGSVPIDYATSASYVNYSVVHNSVRAKVAYTITGENVTFGSYVYVVMSGL